MKTESEDLFVIVNDHIGMVRKDSDGFTVVPCSDDGNLMVSFSDQDSYWKQWASQTNFTARRNKIDFAFVTDSEDCQFCSEKLKQSDFKRVEQTVWSLRVVEEALRSAQEKFNLKGISLFENGKCVKTLKAGDAEVLQALYLTRYGNVEEEAESSESEVLEQDNKEQDSVLEQSQSSEPALRRTDDLPNADSCNDSKALLLKVGDKIEGTVVSVFHALNRCYISSDMVDQQIRVRLPSDMASLPKKEKDKLVGIKLTAEVLSVKGKLVEYRVVF